MIIRNIIAEISSLLVTDHNETRQEMGRGMATLAKYPEATHYFLHEKTLEMILSSLQFQSDLELYHSLAITLGYIFGLQDVQNGKTTIVDRRHILSLLQKENRQIQLAGLWATSPANEQVIMKDPTMLQIIAHLGKLCVYIFAHFFQNHHAMLHPDINF